MASIPSTMKGVIIEKTGGSDVLTYKTDLPVPQPKEGEILVKNDYIGVNFIDTYVLPLQKAPKTTINTYIPLLDTSAPASTQPPDSPTLSAAKPKAPSSPPAPKKLTA